MRAEFVQEHPSLVRSLVLADIADEIVRRLPGARKVVLPGVGHMCNMEDPLAFNRVLLEFLETASRPSDDHRGTPDRAQ